MSAFTDLRAQLVALGTPAALVELAEIQPILGHRMALVRGSIDRAAALLDAPDSDPVLRARLMLRLASVKMAEQDFEGAEQALEAAGRHAPDARALRFVAGARACRIALRRGNRAEAAQTLVRTAAGLPELDDGNDPTWRAVTVEVILGIAECGVEDDPPDLASFAPLAQLVAEVEHSAHHVDAAFAGHQLLAAAALGRGERSAPHLRALVAIAREQGSAADEVEARIALASALVAQQDPISLEEATRTVQIARDRALEHDLRELQRATLLAQAGVLAHTGKTAGAIDRALELARAAQADNDVPAYVASVGVMAELYARTGDHVSAFRTIAESRAALAVALRTDTTPMFRPFLQRLRDRVGAERLDQIAADVDRANRLAGEIAVEKI